MSKESLQQGPYEDVDTTTYEIAGPIKFTVTHNRKSTHVPAAPCGCGGGGISPELIYGLGQMLNNMFTKGDDRAPFAGEGNPSGPFDTSDVKDGD